MSEDVRLLIKHWAELDRVNGMKGGSQYQWKNRVALYQSATAMIANEEQDLNAQIIAKSRKWRLNQWDKEQRDEWNRTVQRAWKTFYDSNESLRKTLESQKEGVPDWLKNRKPTLYD